MTAFTAKYVDRLPYPEDGKARDFYDQGFKIQGCSLGIRVTPPGKRVPGRKRWFIRYRHPDTRQERRVFIGEYGTGNHQLGVSGARREAAAQYGKIDSGNDIHSLRNKRKIGPTVAEIYERYEIAHIRGKRTAYEMSRDFEKNILPHLGRRQLATITRKDIVSTTGHKMKAGKPIAALQTHRHLCTFLVWCEHQGLIEQSPGRGMKPPAKQVERDRYLSSAELPVVIGLYDQEKNRAYQGALQLLLMTGQRRTEVCGMSYQEIDGRWWTIPAERSKNGDPNRVYLTDTAIKVIETNGSSGRYVFAMRNQDAPIRNLINAQNRATETARKQGVKHWTIHDLRRTVATHMGELGITDVVIDKVQNHRKQGMSRIYNRYGYDKEVQEALEKWEAKLQEYRNQAASIIL